MNAGSFCYYQTNLNLRKIWFCVFVSTIAWLTDLWFNFFAKKWSPFPTTSNNFFFFGVSPFSHSTLLYFLFLFLTLPTVFMEVLHSVSKYFLLFWGPVECRMSKALFLHAELRNEGNNKKGNFCWTTMSMLLESIGLRWK